MAMPKGEFDFLSEETAQQNKLSRRLITLLTFMTKTLNACNYSPCNYFIGGCGH
jgi:hypothetical protein